MRQQPKFINSNSQTVLFYFEGNDHLLYAIDKNSLSDFFFSVHNYICRNDGQILATSRFVTSKVNALLKVN